MPETAPFRTWNGRDSWQFVDGVRLHAIGGEQVLLCRVRYEPGKQVPWHAHEDSEQIVLVVEGEVDMTIADETRRLVPGDVAVVNRGVHHKLHSESGVTFIEALAPVPLDHVPDQDADLVLGPDAGALHVEK
jgi:quercetin dioxygenase-like cupin family protein